MADFTQQIVIRAVDNVSATLTKIMGKVGLLGGLTNEIDASFANVTRTTAALTSRLKYMGLAAAGVATSVFWLSYRTSDAAESLLNLSQKTGVSVEELQKLNYVADQSNVGAESLAMGFRFLNRAIGEASTNIESDASKAFAGLNVDLRETDGSLKNTESIFYDLADAFQSGENGPAKVTAAVKLLGRAGEGLIPILNQGSEAIRKQGERFAKYANLLTEEGAKAIADFNDVVNDLGIAFKGIGSIIAQTLIPYIQPLVEQFSNWVANNKELIRTKLEEWIGRVRNAFNELVPKLQDAWAKFTKFWEAIGGFETVIKALGIFLAGDLLIAFTNFGAAIAKLGVLLLATPLGLFATTLGLIGLAVYELNKAFPELGDTVIGVVQIMVEKIQGMFDALWSGIDKTLQYFNIIDKKEPLKKLPAATVSTQSMVANGVSTTTTTGGGAVSAISGIKANPLTATTPQEAGSFSSILQMLADLNNATTKPTEVAIKLDTENQVTYADIDSPMNATVTVNSGPMTTY